MCFRGAQIVPRFLAEEFVCGLACSPNATGGFARPHSGFLFEILVVCAHQSDGPLLPVSFPASFLPPGSFEKTVASSVLVQLINLMPCSPIHQPVPQRTAMKAYFLEYHVISADKFDF